MSATSRKQGQFYARLVLAGWLLLVLVLTLSPNPGRGQSLNLQPGADLTYGRSILNLVVNVLLFVPFGAAAGIANLRLVTWWRVLVIGTALSVVIEITQWFAEVGRQADVNDVLANALGGVIGFLAAVVLIESRGGGPAPDPSLADPPGATGDAP